MAPWVRDRPNASLVSNCLGLTSPLVEQDALLKPKDQPHGNARVILSGMEEPRAKVVELDDAPRKKWGDS
jgi:hypothetical protein